MEEEFHKIFVLINDLSFKYIFDIAFTKLYKLYELIQKMQNYSTENSEIDVMPSRDSLTDFYTKMLKLIKENKAKITKTLSNLLSDF